MKEERRRRSKKNKIEEISKNRGYGRGLELCKIVGATDVIFGELMFLIKWHDCDEFDLLSASEVNMRNPEFVISYYEKRCPINKRAKERQEMSEPIIIKLRDEIPIIAAVINSNNEDQDDKIAESNSPIIDETLINLNKPEEIENELFAKPSDENILMDISANVSEEKNLSACVDYNTNITFENQQSSMNSYIPVLQDNISNQTADIADYETKLLSNTTYTENADEF